MVQKFANHEDAAKSDVLYYRELTPAQRLEILLELIDRFRRDNNAPADRLERVYRIVKLESR